MIEDVLTHAGDLAGDLSSGAMAGLAAIATLGAVLGAARILRPAAMEKVGDLFGADDPVVGMLLWMLSLIGLVWLAYEWSLRMTASQDEMIPALAMIAGVAASGVLAGETWRARRDATATPLRRMISAVVDGSFVLHLLPGRRIGTLTDLRLACALYLFDPLRPSERVWSVARNYIAEFDRERAGPVFARLARYALAFDDLKLHGLRRRDRAEAGAVVADLARMAKALGCLDPATLADIRLIGAALGLQGAEIRQILLRETGQGGDWQAGRNWSQTHERTDRYQQYSQSRRQGFGQRGAGQGSSQGGFGRGAPGPKPSDRDAHYATLGLSPGASSAEIKSAWRRLAKRYHPDRYAGTDMTEAERRAVETRMRTVNAAYEALKT